MSNSRYERAVALGQHAVGRFLDDDGAAHLVADPDRMRRRHDHRPAVGRGPPQRGQDAGQRALDVAALQRAPRRGVVGEVLRRLGQHPRVERPQRGARQASPPRRRRRLRLRRLQRARARQHDAVAVDHPDARRRPRQSLHDAGDLRRRRRRQAVARLLVGALLRERRDRVGRSGEQPRPVVERDRHRLRGRRERALLRVAEEALELAHVLVAEPGQREEHRQHQQQLGADAERDPHRQPPPSARQR